MKRFIALIFALLITLCSCVSTTTGEPIEQSIPKYPGSFESSDSSDYSESTGNQTSVSLSDIPEYSGSPFVAINNNVPQFKKEEITNKSYEFYSPLDSLGRCGETRACVGIDIMPTEDRESISSVRPSGWVNKKYDTSIVDGGYIYNRCHLIGFQLTGENANKENLITGTRYMNVDGMLPFENMIADYVKETENHVMLRVTPIFYGNELVARGVHMEAYSVEDEGDGIYFNVFCYNVQPQITIDYATGESALSGEKLPDSDESTASKPESTEKDYVLNTNTKKFHHPTCSSADDISDKNRKEVKSERQDLIDQGYSPCGKCKP